MSGVSILLLPIVQKCIKIILQLHQVQHSGDLATGIYIEIWMFCGYWAETYDFSSANVKYTTGSDCPAEELPV